MFTYQENTHFSQALPCTKEEFWKQVRKPNTAWRIDARRAIIAAVETSKTQGVAAIQTWLNNSDYQKFLLKKQKLKKESAKKAWAAKSDAEKLLAFAQEIKDNSVAFIYSCYEFDETATEKGKPFRHRRLADCHLNGLVMLDIDHVENPMQIWYKLRDDKELMKKIALVHITSSTFGIRIVSVADINLGNLADNQIVLAEKLGQKPDESCIDATRNSFAPKEEDILYINEDLLFNYYDEDFDKRFTPEYRQKRTQPLRHEFPSKDEGRTAAGGQTDGDGSFLFDSNSAPTSQTKKNRPRLFDWRGYDVQKIIDARYSDKLPCAADSNRHTESLKLATDLLLMLDGDQKLVQQIVEAQSWVKEIIDERDEDVAQTVESAAACVKEKEKKYASSLPSKAMLEAVKAFTGQTYQEIIKDVKDKRSDKIPGMPLEEWGDKFEELFDDFPMMRDLCVGLKKSQYPAAIFVAGGVLMTLMTRCWYRYYHKPHVERRLNCSLFVIGNPGTGKSAADDICEILAAPLEEADRAGKQALNKYKEDTKRKSANKEGKEKPKGLIRVHPARTANGQFITDMINAHEDVAGKEMQLHMFTFDTELDNSTQLQKGGTWINKQSMELKAFHNEKDGQMYSNLDSPVDEFRVTWNFIYTGTPIALKNKVNPKNFGSGLSTRLAVIPMPDSNYKMIDYEDEEEIDWDRMDRMKAWAYRLDTRMGQLKLKALIRKLWEWTRDRMADAEEDDSKANEMMLKRVGYHALNYAVPFIDMRHWGRLHQEGRYWTGEYQTDDVDWKLVELIANIQYATQQFYFGKMAKNYFDDINNDVLTNVCRHQLKTIQGYNNLPEIFTRDDVMKHFGYKNRNGVSVKIARLVDNHLAEPITEGEDAGKFRKINQAFI
ncbi:MAG: hypothetical protein J5502_05790 [Prevotella sp.]|nr:hypothetical protein [Prevotella sp.]